MILGNDFMHQGGLGRGDVSAEILAQLMDQFMYLGGSGKGDISFLNTGMFLGTDLMYTGGSGRGDISLRLGNLLIGDDLLYLGGSGKGDMAFLAQPSLLGTDLIYTGGTGRGDKAALLTDQVVSGRILWRGGASPGNETAWSQSSNWFPQGVPASNSEIALENNGNGYPLILDQNRQLRGIDFNNSSKKIVLGNFRLSISDSIIGGDSLNYIITNGTGCASVMQPVAAVRHYPVGREAYNPVLITNNTATADSFCVCVYDEVRANGLNGAILSRDPRIRRTWDIQKGNGSSNSGSGVDFTFWWNAGEDTLNPVTLFLSHHDGLAWTQQPGTAVTNGRSLFYAGYMGGFSPFAINGNQPLPVSWLYLNGKCNAEKSYLNWATATELNNRRFVIEGSSDGNRWEELSEIPGSGNSSAAKTYSAELNTEKSYIRIRQEDYDGRLSYSDLIYLPCKGSSAELAVIPNPSEGIFRILGSEQMNAYVVFNSLGQKVKEGILQGLPDWKLDLSSMEKGIYSLRLLGEGKDLLNKLVIQ
jgi:hypothetical protein